MWKFLRRLVGGAGGTDAGDASWEEGRFTASQGSPTFDRYFELLNVITTSKADSDYAKAIRAARDTFPILAQVVREMKRDWGELVLGSVPAIDTAGSMMAVVGDRDGIAEMRAAVTAIADLAEWVPAIEETERDADLVERILAVVADTPGFKQNRLKAATDAPDGRRLSTLARWLEDAGRLKRVRVGSTYELYPGSTEFSEAQPASTPGQPASAPTVPTVSTRTRHRRRAEKPAIVDLQRLPYVRLPMAPAAWDERERRGRQGGDVRHPKASLFTVVGADWSVDDPIALAKDERPDPAFRQAFHTAGNSYWLDPRGRSKGFEASPSVLRVTDRTGTVTVERGLSFDVYRSDANTDGSGIIFLSRDGILHAYDHTLTTLFAERVAELPEYAAIDKRLGIPDRELKNHVRCVAISNDRSRYLFTVVDEAWCVGRDDRVRWGLRLPTAEAWTRCSVRTDRVGTSGEVGNALALMDLTLPLTPQDITRRYRQLAMEWHPDRNPTGNMAERMQELNGAMELLTGADLSGLSLGSTETVDYRQILSRETVSVPGVGSFELEASIVVSEKQAADWIYAANFAWQDDRAFLAGYSGRVVEIAPDGTPVRVYDIGAVPRQIVNSGEHLYLLTDTRLYVLAGDRLEALVDVFDRGGLIVGESGFGLVESKSFTWLTPDGTVQGAVRTRDPVRRVLSGPDGLVVETRRHRVLVRGAPSWWLA